ncbi:DUF29 domain-containing protein [Baaleninema simplex]|uniref:DUF29 domain-containing protein n=1 Tax=Baaleninema simplex TaxID=2862350 RepID=UPI0003476B80|nr:DUF29 domain-containing protein [Baaleninema simplex]
MTRSPSDLQQLYEEDYILWLDATVQKLRSHDYNEVDWDNLIEEIEDMGRRERQSLESNLVVVLLHLLKWQFQPERRTGSWESSIIEHRRRIRRAFKSSPSLKNYLISIVDECYESARKQARAETQLSLVVFPVNCPYDVEEILNDEFLPD